ncbi:MAG: choice-of-anchor B family protein [Bacteroidota bacterium]
MRYLFLLAAVCAAALPASAQLTACDDTGMAGDYPCSNVTLLSHVGLETMNAQAGNDVWGWTDSVTGKEYALMGLSDGTAFVDISDPTTPVYLGKLPTHTVATVWRDMKVYGDYAFIVSEADGHGMQVFDLARLRDVAPTQGPVEFDADAHYDRVGQVHNIALNELTGLAIIVGNRESEGCSGGLHLVDVTEPLSPTFAGCFGDDGYTHDVQCVVYHGPDAPYDGHEICLASNEDTVTIVDVTDRKNPVELSQAVYPNPAYTHQGWLTEDYRYFIANDELDEQRFSHNTRSLIFDVSDLDAPEFIGTHMSELAAIDHNLYIRGEMVYEANYRSGLRVLDATNVAEAELDEVAYFDTFPTDDSGQFGGAWSTFPYFDSGTVLISDMQRGLFIVRPEHAEPLALASFTTFPAERAVDLSWKTDGAPEIERFMIEHQRGASWATVGMVQGSPDRDTYRFRAADVADGEQTFRLRAVTADGMTVFSEPVVSGMASGSPAGTAGE